MSYQEKKTVVSILTGTLILVIYCVYALNKFQSGVEDLKTWATVILTFIGIGIAASIAIQIIFHILLSISIAVKHEIKKEMHKEMQNDNCEALDIEKTLELEMVEDEMDKLIELKSMRFGFAIAGIGFVVALISLVLNYSPVVMLNILFLSFSIGSMIESIVQLYFYKRGVKNG